MAHGAESPTPLESRYAELRELRDALDVAAARGSGEASDPSELLATERSYAELRRRFATELAALTEASSAVAAMRAALAGPLAVEDSAPAASSADAAGDDLDRLQATIYERYAQAQSHVRFDDDTIDRLTVFARLAATSDRDERRRLFLALAPVWESVNADNSPASPWRRMIALSAESWRNGDSYVERNLRALGVDPTVAERWLLDILAAWRDAVPAEPIEPWDLHFTGGAVNRALGDRVPHERLRAINDAFYASLGADPGPLGVRYDLEPREGKTPVAFTTFGRRPRQLGEGWRPGEAWVFATYRIGGFDNLAELLHETGHAVHILGIRTRPAFADWPDSDTFTEALAEVVAQEAYEPVWQERWLGASAPLAESLRSKYAAVVLDICWALFELRMHRDPQADPNAVWSDLTSEYLHVAPHPEWSWWAMRGQLVDAPGYMMNYALGAVIVAELRQRIRELRGPLVDAGPDTYAWLSERLYRFGLERSSREVIESFLGRPLSPVALLTDLGRMRSAPSAAP